MAQTPAAHPLPEGTFSGGRNLTNEFLRTYLNEVGDSLSTIEDLGVSTKSGLPAVVDSVITLTPGIWKVDGEILMSDTRIFLKKGAYLIGNLRLRDKLIWDGTQAGPCITFEGAAGDERHVVRDLTLDGANSSVDMFDVSGTGKCDTLALELVTVINASGGNISANETTIVASDLLSADHGFSLTGTCENFVSRALKMSHSGTPDGPLINFNTATYDFISIIDGSWTVAAANFGIVGEVDNGNFNDDTGRGEIANIRFNGAGDPIDQIDPQDLQWKMSDNQGGLSNSIAFLDVHFSGNTSTVVANDVFVIIDGPYDEGSSSRFEVTPADNNVTSLGLNARPFQVSVTMNAKMDSGAPRMSSFQIFHTPFEQAAVAIGTATDEDVTNRGVEVSVSAAITLSKGDKLDVRLKNKEDGTALVVEALLMIVSAIASGV